MTDFVFPEVIETEAWESAALGSVTVTTGVTSTAWTSLDAGRALVLSSAQSFTEAGTGVEIDAFLMSLEPFNVNNGAAFGSVKRSGRVRVIAGGAIPLNNHVISGATVPVRGTTETLAIVANDARAAGSFTPRASWRYIRLVKTSSGVVAQTAAQASVAAAAGDTIMIERI